MSTAWFRWSVDGPRHGIPERCTTLTAVPPGAQRCVRQEFSPGHYKILTVPRADTAINLSGDSGCRLILCKADLNLNPCLNRLVGLFHLPDCVWGARRRAAVLRHVYCLRPMEPARATLVKQTCIQQVLPGRDRMRPLEQTDGEVPTGLDRTPSSAQAFGQSRYSLCPLLCGCCPPCHRSGRDEREATPLTI